MSDRISMNISAAEFNPLELDKRFFADLKESVVAKVQKESYDEAIKYIKGYRLTRDNYPDYDSKTSRYYKNCFDLIYAIKAKKSVVKVASLNPSKKQEVNLRIFAHLNALRKLLSRIEEIDIELRYVDSKYTVLLLKSVMMCIGFPIGYKFINEAFTKMREPFTVFVDDIIRFIGNIFGF